MRKFASTTLILSVTIAYFSLSFDIKKDSVNTLMISYIVSPDSLDINFYWKDDNGKILRSIENLKKFVQDKNLNLIFAMNGGMYKTDNSPQGLYIERQNIHTSIDTNSGYGNFYLKPNGIFFLTNDKKPVVCTTDDFITTNTNNIQFATQSGPMLLINGEIHPAFIKGSSNHNIRNGVGILPDNRIVFAMSKKEINFYDFATYFKDLGCSNALYLDGFVSRTYLPEKNWMQTDGNFGVIIGITKKQI